MPPLKQEQIERTELLKQQKDEAYSQRLELRAEIEQMPKYENWRRDVLEKCGRKCERCGETSDLEVHHKIAFENGNYGIAQNFAVY